MNDSLGDRMKRQYEDRTRFLLPRRTFTIIRLDGKAFHTLTRGCDRLFDEHFGYAMTQACLGVLDEAQGAKLAYIQSDEISVLLTDFDRIETCSWFDGNVQKIASVSAGLASIAFSAVFARGVFDARVFTIPDPVEVVNYFIWRQKDAMRNSVQMCAQARFSPKQLHGKNVDEMKLLLVESSNPWEAQLAHFRQGVGVVRTQREDMPAERWAWTPEAAPVFTEHRDYITSRFPVEG